MIKTKPLMVAMAAALSLSGCSYAAMSPSEQSVIQNGSLFPGADHNLTGCVGPASTENETFNTVYKYPARQIVWNATTDPNHDVDPYIVITSAAATAQMYVPLSVTFDLTKDCNKLMEFHKDFASGYQGWLDDNGNETQGWRNLMAHIIGQPLQDSLNGVAEKYPWQQVYNDEKVHTEFREEIDKALPAAAKARTNGKEYFSNFQVTVLKPVPVDPALKAAIDAQQAAVQTAQADQARGVAQANADKAKADAQILAGQARIDAASKEAQAKLAEINGYGSVDAYLKQLAIKQGLNPFQPQLVPQQVHP